MNPALLPFLMFAFVASITPGPTNILVFSHSARRGVGASVPMILGGCGGAALLVLAVGLGIGHTLAEHPDLQRAMALAGALWLTRMAWQLFRAEPAGIETDGAPARQIGFVGAAGLQLVNPKTWVMGIAVVSLFAGHGDDRTHDVALLSLVFFCVAIPCMFAWAWLGAAAARLLRSPVWIRRFDRLMAVLLFGSAWWGFLG